MYILFDFLFIRPITIGIIYGICSASIWKNEKNIKQIYKMFALWIIGMFTPITSIVNSLNALTDQFFAFLPYSYTYITNTIVTFFFMVLDNLKVLDIIGLIWAMGFMFQVLKDIYVYRNFKKMVLRWSEPVADEKISKLFEDICKKLATGDRVCLCQNRMIKSPFILGVKNCQLVLPVFTQNEILDVEKISLLIHHELIHKKRNDNFLKIVLGVFQSIYWFLPIVKKAEKNFSLSLEMSCDKEVLKGCSAKTIKIYGKMIIDIGIKEALNKKFYINSFSNPELDMKRRVKALVDDDDKISKHKKIFSILLMIIVLCFAAQATQYNKALLTAYTNSKNDVNIFELSDSVRFDKELSEVNFKQYEKFGLRYNGKQDKLYYNGIKVRRFEDPMQKTAFWKYDGAISLTVVRNIKGEIIQLQDKLLEGDEYTE